MRIIKVPAINGLGKTKGAELAPDIIYKGKAHKIPANKENIEAQTALIYKEAKKHLAKNKCLFIGGDHSISFPTTKAFFEKYPKGKLIVFDAHPDCMPPMKEPTHEEWLRGIIENRKIDGKNVLLIGARVIEPEEKEFLIKKNVQLISIEEIKNDLLDVIKKIKDFVGNKKIYLSFDIDVFDSSIVEATGYPVKQGLFENEAMNLLEVIIKNADVIAGDIVEVNPLIEKAGKDKTIYLARKIVGMFSNN